MHNKSCSLPAGLYLCCISPLDEVLALQMPPSGRGAYKGDLKWNRESSPSGPYGSAISWGLRSGNFRSFCHIEC